MACINVKHETLGKEIYSEHLFWMLSDNFPLSVLHLNQQKKKESVFNAQLSRCTGVYHQISSTLRWEGSYVCFHNDAQWY